MADIRLFPGEPNPDNIKLRIPGSTTATVVVTPGTLALTLATYAPTITIAADTGGGRRAWVWIPADTGKRWMLRTMEPDEMVAIAAVLGLTLLEFVTLHAAAEEGALAA